ncbi:hypothetical protein ACFVYE_17080 [Streptomyces sp. NPDC058239]|uniref:hypothetical protein n=1 Tax=unclassified Streptomyces TaxID=2593676 RepID=UPI003649FC06
MSDPLTAHTGEADGTVIPRPASRRSIRTRTALIVMGLAAVTVVPAMLAAPLAEASPVMMTAGFVGGLGCAALPHLCTARKPWHRHGPDARFLTARTWTGPRTIDLHALRSVRTWKEVHRGGATTFLVVTDASGTRLSFTGTRADRLIRRYAVERARRTPDAKPIRMTGLALADLGIRPLPRVLSGLRSLLALERLVVLIIGPMMISAAIASR